MKGYVTSFDHVPTEGGGHTTIAFFSDGDGTIKPFPPDNWCLIAADHKEAIRESARRSGYTIKEPTGGSDGR